ncbi:ribonuclease H-like domain-containing protein [Tanacetum coccineum]
MSCLMLEMLMLSSLVRSLTRLCPVLVLVLVPLRGLSHMCLIPTNRRPTGGSPLVCENCGFNGHTVDKCFKIIGYPLDFGKKTGSNNNNQNGQNFNKRFVNNNSVGSSSSSPFSSSSFSSSLIKDNSGNNVGKGIHANMAGTVFNNSKMFNKNFGNLFCNNNQLHDALVAIGLLVDSGANQHLMYSDKYLVNVIDISKFGIKGSQSTVLVGNMILTKDTTLYDVLVVSEYCVSLMFVRKVARDNKLIIAFDELGHPSDQVLDALKNDIVFEKTNGESFVKFGCLGLYDKRLPTSVLNRKSPYQLVFSKKPSLSHLRAFGCLCFATILTCNDKFSSRSEKCVLVGYSNLKKMTDNNSAPNSNDNQGLNHVNFFNEVNMDDPGVSYDDHNNTSSQSDGSNHLHPDSLTIDLNEDDLWHLYGFNGSIDEDVMAATFDEQNSSSEDINVNIPNPICAYQIHQPLRSYSKLSSENFCFATELNKSHEPKTFWETSSNQHWVDAINKEMDALYDNNTWEIIELPSNKKAIGSKWVFRSSTSLVVKLTDIKLDL